MACSWLEHCHFFCNSSLVQNFGLFRSKLLHLEGVSLSINCGRALLGGWSPYWRSYTCVLRSLVCSRRDPTDFRKFWPKLQQPPLGWHHLQGSCSSFWDKLRPALSESFKNNEVRICTADVSWKWFTNGTFTIHFSSFMPFILVPFKLKLLVRSSSCIFIFLFFFFFLVKQ